MSRAFMAWVVGVAVFGAACVLAGEAPDNKLAEAWKFFKEHSYKRAADTVEEFLRAQAQSPRAAEAQYLLGELNRLLGQQDKAKEALNKVLERKQKDIWDVRARVSLLRMGAGDTELREKRRETYLEAIAFFEDASAKDASLKTELFQLFMDLMHMTPYVDVSGQAAPPVVEKVQQKPAPGQRVSQAPAEMPQQEAPKPSLDEIVERALKAGLSKDEEAQILFEAGSRMWRRKDNPYFAKLFKDYRGTRQWDQYAYQYASNLESQQRYEEALEIYKEITKTYRPDQSYYVRAAQNQSDNIVRPVLAVFCSNIYKPGDPVTVNLNWRNLNKADFELLSCRVTPDAIAANLCSPEELATATAKESLKKWSEQLEDEGKHIPHNKVLSLDLTKPGLYHLTATGAASSKTAILITDLSVLAVFQNDKVVAFAADAFTGKPVVEATIVATARYRRDNTVVQANRAQGLTSADGVAEFAFPIPLQWWQEAGGVFALSGSRIAYAPVYNRWYQQRGDGGYFAYFYTDRPVYRPQETVGFKLLLRRREGNDYVNVPNTPVTLRIYDPRNTRVFEKGLTTDQFGTANDSLQLAAQPALGQYRIELVLQGNQWCNLAQWSPFRVEEYRRPEYEVTVKPGKKLLRSGEDGEALIEATYYFGGPVAEADVEVVIQRQPYYYWYRRPYDYPWYYESNRWGGRGRWWGGQEPVKRETLKTDANGKARVTFKTEKDRDFTYTVEARVVDKSRREVTGTGEIKVTTQPFYLTALPQRYIYSPKDKVQIELVTENANNEPVSVLGNAIVYRILSAEKGKEPNRKSVFTKNFQTGEDGKYTLAFDAPSEGYYEVSITALTEKEEKVQTVATIWSSEKALNDIGYQLASGITLVLDRESYKPGDEAQVLLITSRPGVSIFTYSAGDTLMGYRVLNLVGTSKLFSIPITEQHSPNFYIYAHGMWDGLAFSQNREVVVPPEHRFVKLALKTDKTEFKPRERTTVSLKATDEKGKPLVCSLSLSVFDRSILYIQPDLVPDVRQYYYGQKRYPQVNAWVYNQWRQFYQKPAERPSAPKEWELTERGRRLDGVGMEEKRLVEMEEKLRGEMAAAPMAAAGRNMPSVREADALGADRKAAMDKAKGEGAGGGGPEESMAMPDFIRADFRPTALWLATVTTDANGEAKAVVQFPDSLTDWQLSAKAVTVETRVGEIKTAVRTTKKIIARLEAPRFFVERDDVTVSVIVHNYFDRSEKGTVTLEIRGLQTGEELKRDVSIPAKGEKRLDWHCQVPASGEAYFKAVVQTPDEADALEKSVPILPHGVMKSIAKCGELKGEKDGLTETVEVPDGANLGATRLRVVVSPTLASSMVQALDYLASYPYGCVEQTMSRFIPTVVTIDTLRKLGVSKPEVEKELPKMVEAGLKRIADFQRPDGGWGWWQNDASNPWMTAYVVQGLTMAQAAGVQFDPNMLQRGIRNLKTGVAQTLDLNTQAFCLYALSLHKETNARFIETVWDEREKLSPYALACSAMTFANLGENDKAQTVIRNLENFVEYDQETRQARCGKLKDYWHWWDDAVEASAMALRAYTKLAPDDKLTDGFARWLVLNRRGNRWKSTRDTALAIYAIADYALAKKELDADYSLTLAVNDKPFKQLKVSKDNLFNVEPEFALGEQDLHVGSNTITLQKQGKGALYYSLFLNYYTKEEDVKGASYIIKVDRSYTLLKPKADGSYDREELRSGAEIRSGDRVEVNLKINSKNDIEYVVFEDMKPSGFEPTELRSGWMPGAAWAQTELRDEKVAFFFGMLPQGDLEVKYTLRAEVPGRFHTMPTSGYSMYIPEIRTTSDEFRFGVKE